METWSDKTKFWSETIRIILLAIFGVLGVYFIVDPLKNKTSYEAELGKERLLLKATIIDNFLSKSHKYTAIAFDACNGDTASIRLFQGDDGDNYDDLLNRMSVYFRSNTELQTEIKNIMQVKSSLYGCFKRHANKDEWEPIRL